MAFTRYQLVYTGTLADNWKQDEVCAELATLFKRHPDQLTALFSGRRVILKKNLTKTQARDLRLKMRQAGAIASFEPMPGSIPETASLAPAKPAGLERPVPQSGVQCPKCGQRQSDALSCSGCGLIFAKFKQQQQKQQQEQSEQAAINLRPAKGSRPVQTDVIPKRMKLPLLLVLLCMLGGFWFNQHLEEQALLEQQRAWRAELNQPGIRELTLDQFDNLQQLSAAGRYTVVDLFDSTCEACSMMHNGQQTLLKHDASVAIRRIDITDDHIRHQLYHKLNLSGGYAMPLTVVFAPDGSMVAMDKPGRPWKNQLGKQAFIKMVERAKRSI